MKTQTLGTFITLAIAITALAGCSALRPREDYWIKPGELPRLSRAVSLIHYAVYLRRLSPTEYVREIDTAQQLYATEKTDFRLLQYTLALELPGGDTRKAQQLLEPLAKDKKIHDPELRALATLINSELNERRRLESEVKRIEVDVKKADADAKRADELEKKVEALKNIEKGLIQRDAGESKP